MTPPPIPPRRERFLARLHAAGSEVRTWLAHPAVAGGTAVLALILGVLVFLIGDGVVIDDPPPPTTSAPSSSAPSSSAPSSSAPSSSAPSSSASPTPSTPPETSDQISAGEPSGRPCTPAQDITDDFGDGHVDPCRWQVSSAEPGVYYTRPGLTVVERDGMLIFDVPAALPEGGDAEIFALPTGGPIDEVSMDLVLLDRPEAVSGAVGVIANLGDKNGTHGPLVSLDGGPGTGLPGHDVPWCATPSTDYGQCDHPEPCDSLPLAPNEPVHLTIIKTSRGIETSIGDQPCGVFNTTAEILSVNLNWYADTGARFRMGVDNFHMRVRM
jgi:hypothetical protein